MGLQAAVTGGKGDFEITPAGTYTGICNGVYVVGTWPSNNGYPSKIKCVLTFELHKRKGPVYDKGNRIVEASEVMSYTANVKSTLIEKFAGPLRGKTYTEAECKALKEAGGYDAEPLLGLAAKLTIEHNNTGQKTYANITQVAALDPEDDVIPEMVTDTVYWDYTMETECPKRVAWAWAKALENPARTGQAAMSGLAVEKKVHEVAADCPF